MFGKGLSYGPCTSLPPPSYVRVLFDYGYMDQSKKHVLMRENEILLLLKKTNADWWQVIRRGERRPFYAPAKYVLEVLREPPSPVVDARYISPVTTFGFGPTKRSSYAPPSGSTLPPPAALEARLLPRYRSNSLDSILVSDQSKALLTLRDIPTVAAGNSSSSSYLEKRPTIEALDKRKSWANEARLHQGRLAAYNNHAPRHKKPLPTPRHNKSDPPPTTTTNKGLGKRSKTDLTLEGLSAYKANRVLPSKGPFKKPEKPHLSTFSRKTPEEEDKPLSRVLSESNLVTAVNEDTKSQPLIIMTQPIKDAPLPSGNRLASSLDSSEEGTDDLLTKSSSFDSCFEESSLEESAMLSLLASPRFMDESATSSLSPELKSPVSTTSRSPPSPSPDMTPTRNLMVEWDEYCDEKSGRKFYYNSLTKEKSWKPPRKSKGWSEGYSAPTSPDHESEDKVKRKLDLSGTSLNEEVVVDGRANSEDSLIIDNETKNRSESPKEKKEDVEVKEEFLIPDGYEKQNDGENVYYVNIFTGVRWYSAKDANGKVYFYEENGNESCWSLPNVAQSIQDINHSSCSSESSPQSPELSRVKRSTSEIEASSTTSTLPITKGFVSSPNFQIGSVSIVVLKQGPLNKTKIFENGKKQRKNWCSSHVVLTDTFLLFFKDVRTFASLQNGGSSVKEKPEHVVDLKGTLIEWCKGEKSKRSYAFEVTSALFGLSVLLQGESLNVSAEWFREINSVIERINGGSASRCGSLRISSESSSTKAVSRTKSIKLKFLGSSEELESPPLCSGGASPPVAFDFPPQKSNIREKLKKFFLKRPSMEDLFKRGIIKNEPVFGSTLKELQSTELSEVPAFVKKCVREIEKGDFLCTDGVYRQSGNLSTIQKIRLQVDQGNLSILETLDDVHVLTGALKLFFRELKEPLIPWDCVDDLLQVPTQPSRKTRVKALKDILSCMPTPHRATLIFLLRHLSRVTEFKESNRMQVHNLAIVFGPTLMWPPAHLGASSNLALDMMQQNIIVESLLSHVNNLL